MSAYRGRKSCINCNEVYSRDGMFQNDHDEYVCKECFKRECHESRGHFRRKHRPNVKVLKSKSPEKDNKMFSDIEQLMKKTTFDSKEVSSQILTLNKTPVLSKRPLQCPYSLCNKFIGVLTLESHFKYEHKDVPIVITQLDGRSSIKFYPQDVQFGSKHCIILLSLTENILQFSLDRSKSDSSLTRSSSTTFLETRPCFILLATKVAPIQMSGDDSNELLDDELTREAIKPGTFRTGDKIIIWMASNITTNNSYTVAASSYSNHVRIKYYGPVLPVGDDPVHLCEYGKGLIITNFHYFGMTEDGTKPLTLDIVIHPEED